MAYIPCMTGTVALISQPDGSTLALPVEAWDDKDGRALVASQAALVGAATLPGFVRLEAAAVALPPVVEPRQPERIGPRDKPRQGRRPVVRGPRDPKEGRI